MFYYFYYYLLFEGFSQQHWLIPFNWSLSDSKSPRVFRTLLSILADLNQVIVWMVTTRPLISKSSSPFNNHSLTVTRAPITIGINHTFMFLSFFQFSTRSLLLLSPLEFFSSASHQPYQVLPLHLTVCKQMSNIK